VLVAALQARWPRAAQVRVHSQQAQYCATQRLAQVATTPASIQIGLRKRARRSAAADWRQATVAHGAAQALGSAAVRALVRRLGAPAPPWAAGNAHGRRPSRARRRGWAGAALADHRRRRQLPGTAGALSVRAGA